MTMSKKVEHDRAELRARLKFLLALAVLDVEAFAWFARALIIELGTVPPTAFVWPPVSREPILKAVGEANERKYHVVSEIADRYLRTSDQHARRPIQERSELFVALLELPVIGMCWIARACPAAAMMTGGMCQIWPDGLGGFRDREGIQVVRLAAVEYLHAAGEKHVAELVDAVDGAIPSTGRPALDPRDDG